MCWPCLPLATAFESLEGFCARDAAIASRWGCRPNHAEVSRCFDRCLILLLSLGSAQQKSRSPLGPQQLGSSLDNES